MQAPFRNPIHDEHAGQREEHLHSQTVVGIVGSVAFADLGALTQVLGLAD